MCAIFGYLDYKGILSNSTLKSIIRSLSISAESRGTDATGISYVKDENMVTFKKAKPARKVKLYFPTGTKAVIGHTRMTTQGNEKYNYNNHPFNGECGNVKFSLAHNGVLYNDKELRKKYMLPDTEIETDSYIAVQMIEHFGSVDMEGIKKMAEAVEGSFTFTILRNDNTLFLVKGSNPIAIAHFPTLGIYVYASTSAILNDVVGTIKRTFLCEDIVLNDGEILQVNPDGTTVKDTFEIAKDYNVYINPYVREYADWYEDAEDYGKALLLSYCGMFGISEEDVQLLLDFGYDYSEVEEMLMDSEAFANAVSEIKGCFE